VLPYRKNIKNALDFGCGPEPVLANLLSKKGIPTKVYDKCFYPKDTLETYSLVTAVEVIEHLACPLSAFKKISGKIRKNGYLALSTLFHPDCLSEFDNWWYRRDSTHISFYSPVTLSVLAKKFGLKIIYNNNKNRCVMQKL